MKKNICIIHVTPFKPSKHPFWASFASALSCSVVIFAVALVLAIGFPDEARFPAAGVVVALVGNVCLWPAFWYFRLYLPKFSIALNMTEKEVTLVTPKQRVTAPFREFSYTVTTFSHPRSTTYYLHLYHQGKKLIRINTENWSNIRFLLDLPHKPDPKIRKLRESRQYY